MSQIERAAKFPFPPLKSNRNGRFDHKRTRRRIHPMGTTAACMQAPTAYCVINCDGVGDVSTVQESDCWRVKIGWLGTPPRYFGHFKSEHEAEKWIADHHWMIQQARELVPDEAP